MKFKTIELNVQNYLSNFVATKASQRITSRHLRTQHVFTLLKITHKIKLFEKKTTSMI